MSDRVLLRGGYVLSMDDEIGELAVVDVLVAEGSIAAVGELLPGEGADVVDVSGQVVVPAFVDTHHHTWQTPFRGVCADWTLEDYFRAATAASERVLRAVAADGQPLLPEAPPGFADAINSAAAQNLARAWAIAMD
jgi:cytosine/adenosine deaminase-related metal-dependent hydrolase